MWPTPDLSGERERERGPTLTPALSRKRERGQRQEGHVAPSPPYSGERVGVRGRRLAMLSFVANQVK